MSKFDLLNKWNSQYRCDYCKKTMSKQDSMIVEDSGDRYEKKRLCRDCMVRYYVNDLKRKGIGGEMGNKLKLWAKDLRERR